MTQTWRWTESTGVDVDHSGTAVTPSNGSASARVWVTCTSDSFAVTASRDVHAPVTGPEEVNVRCVWHIDETGEAAGPWGGVTAEGLRTVPMNEIRRRLDRKVEAALRSSGAVPYLPERVESELELAQFASVYATLIEARHTKPLQRLSDLTGVPRNTLSARVRRARERGILSPFSKEHPGSLTPRAQSLLRDLER